MNAARLDRPARTSRNARSTAPEMLRLPDIHPLHCDCESCLLWDEKVQSRAHQVEEKLIFIAMWLIMALVVTALLVKVVRACS